MNSKQIKISLSLFGLVLLSACGKNYNCKCVNTTTTKSGSSTTTNKIETVSTDKYRKRETARLMCENIKIMSTSPSATVESTCTLE